MIEFTAKQYLTHKDCDSLKGKYLDESYFDTLITSDANVYREDGSILFKFRKALLDKNESEVAFLAYKNHAKSMRSRGAAAGPIDSESVYWKKREITKINKGGWSATYNNSDGKPSKMKVSNEVASNAMGYWSETNGLGKNLPCRLTFHTKKDFLKFEDGVSTIQKISNSYKNLHPEFYMKQMAQAQLNPDMTVGDTPFSTITVNRNFRTAVHQDSGDYGFGNLAVFEYGKYHGGYFVIPKYRIAIDMRAGDHLCVDVHEHHANTALYETEEDKIYNDSLPDIFRDNLENGVLGLNNRFARISIVCYLRDELKSCGETHEIDPVYLKPEFTKTSLSVFFVNPLKNSEERKKFYNTKWNRCKSHEDALQRIIKHQLENVIIIDDTCELMKTLGTAKQFTKKDGITYLNIGSKAADVSKATDVKKGIHDMELAQLSKATDVSPQSAAKFAYYVPDFKVAASVLNNRHMTKSYFIHPKLFQ